MLQKEYSSHYYHRKLYPEKDEDDVRATQFLFNSLVQLGGTTPALFNFCYGNQDSRSIVSKTKKFFDYQLETGKQNGAINSNLSHLSRYWLNHKNLYTTGGNIVYAADSKEDLSRLGLPASPKGFLKYEKERLRRIYGSSKLSKLSAATIVIGDGSPSHSNLSSTLKELRNSGGNKKIDDKTRLLLEEQILSAITYSHNKLVQEESTTSNLSDVNNVHYFGHFNGLIQSMMCFHVPSNDYYRNIISNSVTGIQEPDFLEALFHKKKFNQFFNENTKDLFMKCRRLFHDMKLNGLALEEIRNSAIAPRVSIINLNPKYFKFNNSNEINYTTVIYVEFPNQKTIGELFEEFNEEKRQEIFLNVEFQAWKAKTAAVQLWQNQGRNKKMKKVQALDPSFYQKKLFHNFDKDIWNSWSDCQLKPLGYDNKSQQQTLKITDINKANEAILASDVQELKKLCFPDSKERIKYSQSTVDNYYTENSKYGMVNSTAYETVKNALNVPENESADINFPPIAFIGMGIGTEIQRDENKKGEQQFFLNAGEFVPILRGRGHGLHRGNDETKEQYQERVKSHLKGEDKVHNRRFYEQTSEQDKHASNRLILALNRNSDPTRQFNGSLSGPAFSDDAKSLFSVPSLIENSGSTNFQESYSSLLNMRYFPGVFINGVSPEEFWHQIQFKINEHDGNIPPNFLVFVADAIINSKIWDQHGIQILKASEMMSQEETIEDRIFQHDDNLIKSYKIQNCIAPIEPLLKLYSEESANRGEYSTDELFCQFPLEFHNPDSRFAGTIPICVAHNWQSIYDYYYDTSHLEDWFQTGLINYFETTKFANGLGQNTDYLSGGEFLNQQLASTSFRKSWYDRNLITVKRGSLPNEAPWSIKNTNQDGIMSRRTGLKLWSCAYQENEDEQEFEDVNIPGGSLHKLQLFQFSPLTRLHSICNEERLDRRKEKLTKAIIKGAGEDYFDNVSSNYKNA